MVKQRNKLIGVIPARGGSKRIPHKNIVEFMGEPLIGWTIKAAQRSDIFDKIIVSTDDSEIAGIAERYGIEVPFYRNRANDDVTPVSIATIEALNQAQEYWNEKYDVVVQLMANCPLRGPREIEASFDHFNEKKINFQLSCFKFNFMNPWWAFKLTGDLQPDYIFKNTLRERSQDLPDLYCPTGAIWIADTKALLSERSFYGSGHIFFPIDWKAAVDIDGPEDLEFASIVFKQIH